MKEEGKEGDYKRGRRKGRRRRHNREERKEEETTYEGEEGADYRRGSRR